MTLRVSTVIGLVVASVWANAAAAQSAEKVEIAVMNNRKEPVTMQFKYAFREYTWTMMKHVIDEGDDILYRFPANIPGCEKLREWRITDGVLSILNDKGLVCEKRISLCDRVHMTMEVRQDVCNWSVQR
jgi:hypothetical protein